MTTIQKFQAVFFSVISLCVLTIILSFTIFSFIEIDTATNWTMKYFALPILVIMVPASYFIYLKFLRKYERKEYKSKILANLRTGFRIFILTVAMTGIFFATTLSLIILSNAYLGKSKIINLDALIVDYYQTENRGKLSYYIKIKDMQLKNIIELKVEKPYRVGQPFNKTMRIGYWGLLYSKK